MRIADIVNHLGPSDLMNTRILVALFSKMHKHVSSTIINGAGRLLLSMCFLVLLTYSLLWCLNFNMAPFILPCSLGVASLPFIIKRQFYVVFVSLLAIAAFVALSVYIWDYSADGQWYHMPAAWAIAHGWNPIAQHHNTLISEMVGANLWIDHYNKGMETLAASIIALTGNTEAGKAVNGFFLLVTFSFVYEVLSQFWKLPTKKRLFYALILSFSPIVCTELFTFYIDLASYDCIVWLLCLLLIFDKTHSRTSLAYVFMVVYIGSSIKTNLTFWMGFFIFLYLIYAFVRKQKAKACSLAVTSLFAVLLMVVTIGYNPLITNMEDHGNPIYPFGDKHLDPTEAVVQGAQPKYMVREARWKQVVIGMTSRPDGGFLSAYTAPWKLTGRNLSHAGSMTCNVGGGGLFFVDILILSLLLAICCKPSKQFKKYLLFELILILSLFILPYGSCFRYVPFFFLFPIVILLYSEKYGLRYEKCKWLRRIVYVLLVGNSMLAFSVAFGYEVKNTYIVKTFVQRVKRADGTKYVRTTNWSFLNKITGTSVKDKCILQDMAPNSNFVLIPYQRNANIWIDSKEVDMKLHVNNSFVQKVIEL